MCVKIKYQIPEFQPKELRKITLKTVKIFPVDFLNDNFNLRVQF
jgi:hypothetical protein